MNSDLISLHSAEDKEQRAIDERQKAIKEETERLNDNWFSTQRAPTPQPASTVSAPNASTLDRSPSADSSSKSGTTPVRNDTSRLPSGNQPCPRDPRASLGQFGNMTGCAFPPNKDYENIDPRIFPTCIFLFLKRDHLLRGVSTPLGRLGGRAGPSPVWTYHAEGAGRRLGCCVSSRQFPVVRARWGTCL